MRSIVCVVFVLLSFGGFLQAVNGEPRSGSRQIAGGHPAGAPRLAIRWAGNGRVYHLLSRGAEYVPSRRTGNTDVSRPTVVIRESNETVARRLEAHTKSGSGAAPTEATQTDSGDVMMADNPYDPYKSIHNDVYNPYYNYYDSYHQPRHRHRVRHGYGTRFFQNGEKTSELYVCLQKHSFMMRFISMRLSTGLPDLIPDAYYVQAYTYIQRVPMYNLRCAAEEHCLTRLGMF